MESEGKAKSDNVIAGIFKYLPPEAKGVISALIVFIALFATVQLMLNMPTFFKQLASLESAKEQCWELSVLNGTIFKFNRCTGEVSEVATDKESKVITQPSEKPASNLKANP